MKIDKKIINETRNSFLSNFRNNDYDRALSSGILYLISQTTPQHQEKVQTDQFQALTKTSDIPWQTIFTLFYSYIFA